MWTLNLTLLEDQGLWIKAPVLLHCSCAKVALYKRSPEMEYTILQKCSYTIIILIPRNASPPYHLLAESKANLRTSLFKERAPNVSQNVAQEPTLYYSGPIYIGGPSIAYWAKGASLGTDIFLRKSRWDQNIYDMPWKVQISFWRGLTRPRKFTFAFVSSASYTCMVSELFSRLLCCLFMGLVTCTTHHFFRPI